MMLSMFIIFLILIQYSGSQFSSTSNYARNLVVKNTFAISPFPTVELQALHDLYYQTNGDGWSWPSTGKKWNFTEVNPNPCYEQWAGITCTSNCTNNMDCNVLYLELTSVNMKGQLPNSIGDFSFLSQLNFENNTLSGSIPSTIGNLYNLRLLSMKHNLIEHQLPDSIGYLFNLNVLLLGENSLTGRIPSTIGGLLYLYILNFENNYLSGPLPAEIGYLSNLRLFSVFGNALNESIATISSLANLRVFIGSNNFFSQNLPDFSQLTHLQYFSMSSNILVGHMSSSIGTCTGMYMIELASNALSGPLPSTITSLSVLKYLYLYSNHFSGPFPSQFDIWNRLYTVDVNSNHFTGTLSPKFGLLYDLDYVDLSYNRFNGTLSDTHFANLSTISDILFSNNEFSGSIPESIYNASSYLYYLDLSSNRFTGTISNHIGQLSLLVYIYLNDNRMHGTIPESIGNLTTLQYLGLGDNAFSGSLPKEIGVLYGLIHLIVSNNSMYGTIPSTFGNLTSLQILSIEFNQFSGTLPWSLWEPASHAWGLKNINIFWVQNNLLSGNLNVMEFWRKVVDLNTSSNFFTGQISNNIHRMNSLSSLDVSANYLTGSLGTALSKLTMLQLFSLAKNSFSGNLDAVFMNVNFTNIDISDNAFTGSIPAAPFRSNSLTTFAAVKNCLSGALPTQTICDSTTLQTLALDGLYTAEDCQDQFFPDIPQLTSYQLNVNLPGGFSSLRCMLNMSNLQTLHLSGNAITGSLPSDLLISDTLRDLSLSYNILTGSIPLVIQEKKNWLNLDLSFNKLNGLLDDKFARPSNATSISLIVNRLSGFIPSSLLDAENIEILNGNLFNCDGSTTYRTSLGTPSGVPINDNYAAAYQCGSDDINSALYIWITLAGVMTIASLFIVFFGNYLSTNVEDFMDFVNWIHFARQRILEVIEVYRSDYTAKFHQRITPIFVLGKSMEVIRKIAALITCYALVILLPAYCIVSIHNGTHSIDYAWTTSLGYLTGVIPATVVLLLMVIFYALFASSFNSFVLESSGLYSYQHKAVTDEQNAASSRAESRDSNGSNTIESPDTYNSIKLESFGSFMLLWMICFNSEEANNNDKEKKRGGIDWRSLWIGFQITCFNCFPVLIVNMCYVYLTTLNLSPTDMGFIVLAISLFKIAWNNIMVLGVFSDYMNQDDPDTDSNQQHHHRNRFSMRYSFRMSRFSDVAKKVTQESIAKVQFLAHLTIFNNILAPCLADAFIDPDCFYYVVQPPPDVSASYAEQHCVTYQYTNQTVFCSASGIDVHSTSYNPPFIYSYECTSAILNGFCTVFVYKYIISSIFVPFFKYAFLWLEEHYAISQWPAKFHQQFFEENTNKKPLDEEELSVSGLSHDGNQVIQLGTLYNYISNRSTATPTTSTTTNATTTTTNAAAVKQTNTSNLPRDSLMDSNRRDSESATSAFTEDANTSSSDMKIFNKEGFVVILLGDLAVLVTFGLAFPPLALVICFGIYVNTFYHQLRIGNFIIAARKEREQHTNDTATNSHASAGSALPVLSLIRNTASTAFAKQQLKEQWQAVVEKLRVECGDLMRLFWPAIPTLSLLSAIFIGAFLFDILGDKEGALDAMWILLVMPFLPISIWLLEYLYLVLRNKRATATSPLPSPSSSNAAAGNATTAAIQPTTAEKEGNFVENPVHSNSSSGSSKVK